MNRVGTALCALLATALLVGGCGDDDDDVASEETATESSAPAVPGANEAAALQEEIADQSAEDQIVAVGEAWAEPFADGDEVMCAYLHPDLGGASSCDTYVQGALTGSINLQRSFGGTTVDSVAVDGDTAIAEFSNGEEVGFAQDPDGAWKVSETPR